MTPPCVRVAALARHGSDLGLIVCFSQTFGSSRGSVAPTRRHVLREGLALASLAIMNDTEAMLLARANHSTMPRTGSSLTDRPDGDHPRPATVARHRRQCSRESAGLADVEVVYDIGAGMLMPGTWRREASGDPVLAANFAAAALKISRPPESVHMPDHAEAIDFLRQRRRSIQ